MLQLQGVGDDAGDLVYVVGDEDECLVGDGAERLYHRGGAMALRRVLRCNPLAKGGYDPVPQAPSAIIRRDENP